MPSPKRQSQSARQVQMCARQLVTTINMLKAIAELRNNRVIEFPSLTSTELEDMGLEDYKSLDQLLDAVTNSPDVYNYALVASGASG